MALDGVMIDVPETPENLQYYGKPEGGTRRPFPQTRTFGLAEAGTRAVIAVQLGTIYQGERELAKPPIGSFTPEMLIAADRGVLLLPDVAGLPGQRGRAGLASVIDGPPPGAAGTARRESPRVCRGLHLLGRMGSCREELGATRRS